MNGWCWRLHQCCFHLLLPSTESRGELSEKPQNSVDTSLIPALPRIVMRRTHPLIFSGCHLRKRCGNSTSTVFDFAAWDNHLLSLCPMALFSRLSSFRGHLTHFDLSSLRPHHIGPGHIRPRPIPRSFIKGVYLASIMAGAYTACKQKTDRGNVIGTLH